MFFFLEKVYRLSVLGLHEVPSSTRKEQSPRGPDAPQHGTEERRQKHTCAPPHAHVHVTHTHAHVPHTHKYCSDALQQPLGVHWSHQFCRHVNKHCKLVTVEPLGGDENVTDRLTAKVKGDMATVPKFTFSTRRVYPCDYLHN